MKRIKILFLALILGVSVKAAESPADMSELRRDLQASKSVADESYPKALDAYVKLMESGKTGFEVLANAWVSDHIPEDNWLQWYDDFSVRYGKGVHDNITDAYYTYLNARMVNDDAFASAAAKRLNEVYDNQTLVEWLKAPIGQRRVAYKALKEKYPDVPKFSFDAGDKTRTGEIVKIQTFLRGQK